MMFGNNHILECLTKQLLRPASSCDPRIFLSSIRNGSKRKIAQTLGRCRFVYVFLRKSHTLIPFLYNNSKQKKTASSLLEAPKASTRPASASANKPSATSTSASAAAASAKKRGLKAKAVSTKRGPGQEGHVLGGADYVNLMMGSRKRAKEEAMKLPVD